MTIAIDEFIQLCKEKPADDARANSLLQENPSEIAKLFTTPEQFIELCEVDKLVASEMFSKRPIIILKLFTTSEQFIELSLANEELAHEALQINPERITKLFTTFGTFIDLLKVNPSLADAVFRANPDRIAALFYSLFDPDPAQKIAQLKLYSYFLAEQITEIHKNIDIVLHIPRQDLSANKPDLVSKPKTQIPPPSPKRDNQSPSLVSKPNGSFQLKLLDALAILGGVAAILVGAIMAQPILIILGVASVGFGFFLQHEKKSVMSAEADIYAAFST